MPIEIKELLIRMTVQDAKGAANTTSPGATDQKAALIAECVEKVMELLESKQNDR